MSSRTPIQHEPLTDVHRRRTNALALALLASAGAGALWFALATVTGLIFHFLPGATFLAAAWTYRWRQGGTPMPWIGVGILSAGASAATAVILAALVAAGRPLDEPALTAAVAVAGAAFAAALLRRQGALKYGTVAPDAPTPLTTEAQDR